MNEANRFGIHLRSHALGVCIGTLIALPNSSGSLGVLKPGGRQIGSGSSTSPLVQARILGSRTSVITIFRQAATGIARIIPYTPPTLPPANTATRMVTGSRLVALP